MGEAVSSVTIKDRIRKMIEGEDTTRPLSDSRIAEILGARRAAAGPPHGGQVPRGAPHPSLQPSQVRPLTRTARRRRAIPEVGSCRSSTRAVRRKSRAALKTLAERKLRKLERVLGRITHVHVVLAADKHRQSAEVSVNSPHLDLTATEESSDLGVSLARSWTS